MLPCVLCKQIRDQHDKDYSMEAATRVVSWETPGSPMVPVCDNHAFAFAKEKLMGLDNIIIDELDNAMDWDDILNGNST